MPIDISRLERTLAEHKVKDYKAQNIETENSAEE